PSANRRIATGLQRESAFRLEVLHQSCGQRMLVLAGAAELLDIGETVFTTGVVGDQTDGRIIVSGDQALRHDVDGEVESDSARVKEVERPEVERAPGEVGATGRVRGNGVRRRGRCDRAFG